MKLSNHFDDTEFACACGCWRGLDPGDISPVLVAGLEYLRMLVGHPIHILSGCRCVAHNRAVGGSRNSRHTMLPGQAADIFVPGTPPRRLYTYAELVPEFGGLGVSDAGGFLHVDVRLRLTPLTVTHWCYKGGKEVDWYAV